MYVRPVWATFGTFGQEITRKRISAPSPRHGEFLDCVRAVGFTGTSSIVNRAFRRFPKTTPGSLFSANGVTAASKVVVCSRSAKTFPRGFNVTTIEQSGEPTGRIPAAFGITEHHTRHRRPPKTNSRFERHCRGGGVAFGETQAASKIAKTVGRPKRIGPVPSRLTTVPVDQVPPHSGAGTSRLAE